MTYSINNVPLDNPGYGWRLMAATRPHAAVEKSLTVTRHSGHDGVNLITSVRNSASIKLTVAATEQYWQPLVAMFSQAAIVVRNSKLPGMFAEGVLSGMSDPVAYPRSEIVVADFTIEIPAGCWRADVVTTPFTAAAATGASLTLFPDLATPIQDAIVRIKGSIQKPQLVDSSGAFVAFDATIAATKYLRFHSDTGRAWLTSTNTWSGGTEVSDQIDYGGPRGVFEITPQFTDPETRSAQLDLTQETYTNTAGVEVRGRSSFLF